MDTKGEGTFGSPVSPAVEALYQAEDALVDPIALTGGNHLLNAPPWDAEKEKVSLPPKARCGLLLTDAKILLDPYEYLLKVPGKDIRSLLITAFNVWLKVPPESLKAINKVVAMLHTASLLYDCPRSFLSATLRPC